MSWDQRNEAFSKAQTDAQMAYIEAEREVRSLQAENAKLREELAQWERLTAGIELPDYPIVQFKPKDLERENAKLREEIEAAKHDLQVFSMCSVQLDAENARLRKLLQDVAICASGNYCFDCPHQHDGCDRDERLRAEGIEVGQ